MTKDASTAEYALFYAQERATFSADNTKLMPNIVFCPSATGRRIERSLREERIMYELDNRKDQIMTVCKLALANLAMWTRDQCFPVSYAHATWARLAPFFQLPGSITSHQQVVSVQLRPFHDRQYNRDLSLLCQRVNEKQLHLPDGRLLLFSMQEIVRPLQHQQHRLNA